MLGWIQTIVISILESVFGITPGGSPIPSSYLDTDGTLAANSDTKIATQKAVKTYADQLIASADAMIFKGVIDCSANPNYPAADRGHTYRVSVAGKIGGASGPSVENGDLLMCMTDGTPSGTQAAVGAQWAIAQTNIDGALISGGALGTPASGNAVNLTGLPISTGVAGLGTGVATALAVNLGSAGAVAKQTAAVASIGITIDGGGSAITTGIKGYFYVPFACTINSATLTGDLTGSIVIDIWKLAFSTSALPTVANTITASAKPTLSSAKGATDTTLTGWTVAVAAGDVLGYNVDSCTTTTKATLVLKVTKT